jgi:diadenosine tetraphosphate (Ap4A) HIT family hydrolase
MDTLIYQTKFWKIDLSDNQYYLGRCYVSLKRQCPALSQLTKEEMLDFFEIAKKLEPALKKAFGSTMFNWTCLMNNAYKSENPKPQVHFHFKPRYNHKVNFEGEVFEDKEFAHHYDHKAKKEVSEEIMRKIIEKIKANM